MGAVCWMRPRESPGGTLDLRLLPPGDLLQALDDRQVLGAGFFALAALHAGVGVGFAGGEQAPVVLEAQRVDHLFVAGTEDLLVVVVLHVRRDGDTLRAVVAVAAGGAGGVEVGGDVPAHARQVGICEGLRRIGHRAPQRRPLSAPPK